MSPLIRVTIAIAVAVVVVVGMIAWRAWVNGDQRNVHNVFAAALPTAVRDMLPVPHVSIPLGRLVLCLNDDCNSGFEIGGTCPACGGIAFLLRRSSSCVARVRCRGNRGEGCARVDR